MIKSENVFLTLFCAAVLSAAAGCGDSGNGGSGGNTSTGGSSSTGGTGSTGEGIAITPDATGWVQADTNEAGVQGAWYAYGDGTDGKGGPGTCQAKGMHKSEECSSITTPAPGMFANQGGKMCTSGTVAKVINLNGAPDYSNVWGAGIGLDLANSGGDTPVKSEFDAAAKGITGISFEIDKVPLPGLRVEFPSLETDAGTAGGDYWGADSSYTNSKVVVGVNVVPWTAVKGPTGHVFNPAKILSIQFHVPTNTSSSAPYEFCISNLKLLK